MILAYRQVFMRCFSRYRIVRVVARWKVTPRRGSPCGGARPKRRPTPTCSTICSSGSTAAAVRAVNAMNQSPGETGSVHGSEVKGRSCWRRAKKAKTERARFPQFPRVFVTEPFAAKPNREFSGGCASYSAASALLLVRHSTHHAAASWSLASICLCGLGQVQLVERKMYRVAMHQASSRPLASLASRLGHTATQLTRSPKENYRLRRHASASASPAFNALRDSTPVCVMFISSSQLLVCLWIWGFKGQNRGIWLQWEFG